MTTDQKIQTLDILRRMLFKTKSEREAQRMLIDSIKKELIPRDTMPLELTEVYRDKPHVKTTHQSWPEVMDRIEKVRDNEQIYAIHVTRGGEIEYSWEAEKK